jgi:hypothetical protein
MSASWLKGIERGTRLPPRLPLLVKLAEAPGEQAHRGGRPPAGVRLPVPARGLASARRPGNPR